MSVEYNCILIRFGEIFLKGHNKKYFEDLLINNIKNALNTSAADCSARVGWE